MAASPESYVRVFEGHHEGALILEDLVRRFYDVNTYVPGGVEGQRESDRRSARREVIHYILHRIGSVKDVPTDDAAVTQP